MPSFRLPCVALLFLVVARVADAAPAYTTPYTFAALAGEPSAGSADGVGRAARFCDPQCIARDSAGNLYVTDESNHTVRKITPAGVVTTLAGAAGFADYVDGPAATARFRLPHGIAVDAAGTLYVADSGNNAIRVISPSGQVTTLAGNGQRGTADGTGANARFEFPWGLTLAPGGDLFVADMANNTIRRVTLGGIVTTYAGTPGVYGSADGTGADAQFAYPSGIGADATGTLYVTETIYRTVRKIAPGGVVTTVAGGLYPANGVFDGQGAAATFGSPLAVTVDVGGNLYVADWAIRKISPAGNVTTLAGRKAQSHGDGSDGTGETAQFSGPSGIVVDPAGNLFVVDHGNNTIRKVTAEGTVTTIAGVPPGDSEGSADGTGNAARFHDPSGIARDAQGNLYVTDTNNHTVRRVSSTGAVTTLAGAAGKPGNVDGVGAAARLTSPLGIAIDPQGSLYVSDGGTTIRKITADGAVSAFAGGGPGSADGAGAAAGFRSPAGLATDAAGNLYVADAGNHTIRKVTSAGAVTTLAGAAGLAGSADGTGVNARFNTPVGLAVNASGELIVADSGNATIRKISTDGRVTTLAGSPGLTGDADGVGGAARFRDPRSVSVDATGVVLVADAGSNTVRRIAPDGTVTTVGGWPEARGSAGGKAELARFNYPSALTLDASGTIYVVNAGGDTVVQGAPAGRPMITTQPAGVSTTVGSSVQLTVVAAGDPTLVYQWYLNGATLAGATGATLTLNNVQPASAGDYTVAVANSLGSVLSNKATLSVTAAPANPPPGSPSSGGGGGGGGAPSSWFVALLAALALARWRGARRLAV